MSKNPINGSLFLAIVSVIGCSGGPSEEEFHLDTPRTVQQEVTATTGDQAASPLNVAPAKHMTISPEIDDTLQAAGAISDSADSDYERKLLALREKSSANGQLLRTAIDRLPASDHATRRLLLSVLGDVGMQQLDAEKLEYYAVRPFSSPASSPKETVSDGNEEVVSNDVEADNGTTWLAMFALARLGERAPVAAERSIQHVLQTAARSVAFGLGVELQENGRFSVRHRRIMTARGIDPRYEKSDEPEPLRVDSVVGSGGAAMSLLPPQQEQ